MSDMQDPQYLRDLRAAAEDASAEGHEIAQNELATR
jgi:hypothetical protein